MNKGTPQHTTPPDTPPPALQWWAESFRLIRHTRKPPAYEFPKPQRHQGYELVYADYGRLDVRLADTALTLGPGDAVIVGPQVVHQFAGPAHKTVQFLNIIFFGWCPDPIVGRRLPIQIADHRLMRQMCDEVQKQQPHSDRMALAMLNQLLITLARRGAQVEPAEPIEPENRLQHRRHIVASALRYLEAHLNAPLDTTAIANHTGTSPSYLRRLVHRETGQSLRRHQLTMRVNEAQRLLHESPSSIKEVAYRVGYRSVAHFCNMFKAETGLTPGQYTRALADGKGVSI